MRAGKSVKKKAHLMAFAFICSEQSFSQSVEEEHFELLIHS